MATTFTYPTQSTFVLRVNPGNILDTRLVIPSSDEILETSTVLGGTLFKVKEDLETLVFDIAFAQSGRNVELRSHTAIPTSARDGTLLHTISSGFGDEEITLNNVAKGTYLWLTFDDTSRSEFIVRWAFTLSGSYIDQVNFGSATIPNQSFTVGEKIVDITLPEAFDAIGTPNYALSPALPDGLTLTGRVISGTPTTRFASAEFTWTVSDDEASASLTFYILVIHGTIPSFGDGVAIQNRSWRVEDLISFSLPIATGDDPITYTLSPGLPASTGLTLSGRTISGQITGTLELTEFTWTATDTHGETSSLKFSILIQPKDLTPSFQSNIDDQVWRQRQTLVDLTLPEAVSGDGVLTYSLTPALPPGVSLNLLARRITGTPSVQLARTEYTWEVTDEDGDKARVLFFIRVREPDTPPSLSAVPSVLFFAGEDNTYTLPTATGGNGELVYSVTGIPENSGISFNPSTRVLSGNPSKVLSTTPLTYHVEDEDGDTGSTSFSLTIGIRGPDIQPSFPTGTSIPNQTWEQDQDIGIIVLPAATGGNPPLEYRLSPELPPGVNFNSATREITGTPTSYFASSVFTYSAYDANNDSVSLQFRINVREPDVKPSWPSGASIADLNLTTGVAMTAVQLPAALGGNGVPRYDISPSLPEGINFDATTRMLSGTPTFILQRTQFTYRATDRDGDEIELTFHITIPDTQPRFISQVANQSWKSHAQLPRFILPAATGGNRPYTYTLSGRLPTGVMFNSVTREITGTPTETQEAKEYTYTARDVDNDPVSQKFTIAVPDTAPTFPASVVDQVWERNRSLNLQLPLAVGGNGRHTHTLFPALPQGVNVNVGTGLISGTPTAFYNRTLFTWTATDEDGDTISLDFYISIPNRIPSFQAGASIPNQEWITGRSISLLQLPAASGGNGVLRYSISPGLPTGVRVDLTTRRVTGIPSQVIDRTLYTWTVTDEDGSTDTLTFYITVPNLIPTFAGRTSPDLTMVAGEEFSPVILPEASGGNRPLVYSVSPALPLGISFSPAARRISGAPRTVQERTQYSIIATDVDGDSVSLPFFITVTGKPISFAIDFPNQRWDQNSDINVVMPAATGGDGGELEYSMVFEPLLHGLAFQSSTRRLFGKPTRPGTYVATYVARDKSGSVIAQSFNIIVRAEPQPTYKSFQPLPGKRKTNIHAAGTDVTVDTNDPTPEEDKPDSSKPDVTTGFIAYGQVRKIRLEWDNVFDTFTSFKRWEIQVNETGATVGATWYSIRNDGQRVIGRVNEVTPVVTNYYDHTVPIDDKTLYYRIRVVNDQGIASDWSDGKQATTLESGEEVDTTKPARPTGFNGDGRVRQNFLSWDYVSGLAAWELQVSEDNSAWYSLRNDGRAWLGNLNEDTNVSSETFIHNVQADNKTLYYRLKAQSKAGIDSDWTDPIAVTTRSAEGATVDLRIPNVPTGLATVEIDRIIRILWHAAPPPPAVALSHWELQVSSGDNGPWYALSNNENGDWKVGPSWSKTNDLQGFSVVTINEASHFPLPIPKVGNSTTELTLYYRIRAVTHAGKRSAWTDPVSGTARGITKGQLASSIVDAYIIDPENFLSAIDGDSLVAWLPLDDLGDNNLTGVDISGNKNNIEYTRRPTIVKGAAGSATSFPSSSYRGRRGSLGSRLTRCSISVWIQTGGSGAIVTIGSGTRRIEISISSTTLTARAGGRVITSKVTEGVSRQRWTHIALAWGGGNDIELWVNGLMSGAAPTGSGTSSVTPSTLIVGSFRGVVDELRIYNRKLDVGEIRLLMLFPTGPTPGMIIGDRIVAKSVTAAKLEADILDALLVQAQSAMFVTPSGVRLEDRVVSTGDIETIIDNDELLQRRALRNDPTSSSHWEIITRLKATGRSGFLEMWDRANDRHMRFDRNGIIIERISGRNRRTVAYADQIPSDRDFVSRDAITNLRTFITSTYTTKTETNRVRGLIPDISGLATDAELDAVRRAIPDLSGYATPADIASLRRLINAKPDTITGQISVSSSEIRLRLLVDGVPTSWQTILGTGYIKTNMIAANSITAQLLNVVALDGSGRIKLDSATGTLSADHIDSDVFNVETIFKGRSGQIGSTSSSVTITIPTAIRSFVASCDGVLYAVHGDSGDYFETGYLPIRARGRGFSNVGDGQMRIRWQTLNFQFRRANLAGYGNLRVRSVIAIKGP